MNFSHDKAPGKSLTGITIVILLHALVGYAVISGLGKRMMAKVHEAVETKLIEEVKPPPPKDVPPPPPPPEMKAPPPPFIPPVEVNVQQPAPAPVMANTTSTAPATKELARPQAPVAAKSAATGVRSMAVVDFSTCSKPEWPKASLRNEETGMVTLKFLIGVDGHVIKYEVLKSSGFKDLDKAAMVGLSKCKFKPGTTDGKPEESWSQVQYTWTLE